MLHRLTRYFSFIVLSLLVVQAHAALIPAPPQIAARAYLVMDADSGKIIMAQAEDERFPPASLTKMMTAYVAEYEIDKGNISPDDKVLISEKAWRTKGSRMFVREGTQVRMGDLLRGIIIQSGNDASVAVAEHIGGSEGAFADLMNQHAQLLGMENTHFMNATGLPAEGHYASAHDMAVLAKAIIQRYPDQYDIYAEKYFTYNNIRQPNRNRLLWRDKSVDGLKTGHTEEAGYCLVASAKRDGMRLISVVMGTRSDEARAQESQKLLSYAFRYYRTHQLYDEGEVLNNAKVWAGEQDQVQLGLAQPLVVTVPRSAGAELNAVMDIDNVIKAPLEAGQQYGVVRVMLGDEEVETVPLVAMQAVEEAGLFKRIWHSVVLFFTGLIS